MEMKKQKEIMAFLVIIGIAAFFIPTVSADGGGCSYSSVVEGIIEGGTW
jgi:hypothetical protein